MAASHTVLHGPLAKTMLCPIPVGVRKGSYRAEQALEKGVLYLTD